MLQWLRSVFIRKLTNEEKKARDTILQLISDYRTELEAITLVREDLEDTLDPVLVEGETMAGYYCQMMIGPKLVAEILLKYDYPIFRVLGEEGPDAMWHEIASKLGLASVSSVDL